MEVHILLHFFSLFFFFEEQTMHNTVSHGVDVKKQFPLYTSSGHREKNLASI